MSTKQLYEKTSEGLKEFNPLVNLKDIQDSLSDTDLGTILNLYNHIKVDWKTDAAQTRRQVPIILRRSGMFITYHNGTKFVTEFYIGSNDTVQTSAWEQDSNWTKVPDADYISAGVKPGVGTIGYEQLNDNLKQLFRDKVNVTNYPDDEDICSQDNLLKLKDREADASNFQSKGYVILRKNLVTVNGIVKNILTQNMINKPDTIYEIRYDFDLNGETIEVPENCTLKFEGGSLENGTILFDEYNNNVIGYRCLGKDLKIRTKTGKTYTIAFSLFQYQKISLDQLYQFLLTKQINLENETTNYTILMDSIEYGKCAIDFPSEILPFHKELTYKNFEGYKLYGAGMDETCLLFYNSSMLVQRKEHVEKEYIKNITAICRDSFLLMDQGQTPDANYNRCNCYYENLRLITIFGSVFKQCMYDKKVIAPECYLSTLDNILVGTFNKDANVFENIFSYTLTLKHFCFTYDMIYKSLNHIPTEDFNAILYNSLVQIENSSLGEKCKRLYYSTFITNLSIHNCSIENHNNDTYFIEQDTSSMFYINATNINIVSMYVDPLYSRAIKADRVTFNDSVPRMFTRIEGLGTSGANNPSAYPIIYIKNTSFKILLPGNNTAGVNPDEEISVYRASDIKSYLSHYFGIDVNKETFLHGLVYFVGHPPVVNVVNEIDEFYEQSNYNLLKCNRIIYSNNKKTLAIQDSDLNIRSYDGFRCDLNRRGTKNLRRDDLTEEDKGITFFNFDTLKMNFWTGSQWICSDGFNANYYRTGNVNMRPKLTETEYGFMFFDTTLKKMILWNGTSWVNLDGTQLS